MAKFTYPEQKDLDNTKKLRALIKELPPFCSDFFRGIEPRTSTRTRIAYAYDLRIFFDFLRENNPQFSKLAPRDITLSMLEQLGSMDIEEYMDFLHAYSRENRGEMVNTERGLTRKLASLKSFYNYYFRMERISTNPAALVQLPKIHEKEIIRLEIDEVARLLDEVEGGDKLTEKQ